MSESNRYCIRHTELPSTTRLFADLLYDFDRVSSFYHHPPLVNSISSAAQEVKVDPSHRRKLVEALRDQNSQQASGHLDLLAQPETVAVATGQQVGLYGGPVFTLFKALSALKLAAELRKNGTPAVAVFWLATEDHDLAEVDHTWVFDRHNRPLPLKAAVDPPPNQPVGTVPLQDSSLALLRETLAGLPFGEEVSELASETYHSNSTFQSGFQRLYEGLLSRYGLIFLDPMQAGIRELAAPLVRRAIEETPELTQALLERGDALEAAGYHAQVRVTEETSLVFLMESGRRVALRRDSDSYSSESGSFSVGELLARLEERPEDFSPNALLRPVTQDFLLPTAAYLGGPAELAYLAQAEVLYQRLLGRMPVVMPRASFTILDSRSQRLLSRYGLNITDCFSGPGPLRRKFAENLIPPSLERMLDRAEAQIRSSLDDVHRELERFDSTLGAALETGAKKMLYQYERVRGKVGQESLRRDDRAVRDAAYLSNLVFPEKHLQERFYSVLPFLARHGLDLVNRLYEAVSSDCHQHQVWSE